MLKTSSVKWEIKYLDDGPEISVIFPDGSVLELHLTQWREDKAAHEDSAELVGGKYMPPQVAKSKRSAPYVFDPGSSL